jgi:hypothetical protein
LGYDHTCALVAIVVGTLASQGAVNTDGAPIAARYLVSGHQVRVDSGAEGCWLVDHGKGGAPKRLKLDLRPPCYLLVWRHRPPTTDAQGISDGVPVGGAGEPMAFRYKVARGTVAIAVIGDSPVPDPRPESMYQTRLRQGYHCTGSMQGIRFRGSLVQVMPKEGNGQGLFCVEIGLEEKDFWMIAHD